MLVLRRFAEGPQVTAPHDADPEFNRQLEKVKQLQPEDALLIYFSGHATAVDGHLFLLPHDFVAGAKQSRDARTISDVELNDALEPLNPGKLLMVLDACHTGQALGGEREGYAPGNSKGLAQLAYDKGMYILTAAQSYQAALELSRTQSGMSIEHGLLTYSLLEGFANARPDNSGIISEREWMNYAVEQVPLLQVEDSHAAGSAELSQSKRGTKLVDDDQETIQLPRVFYRRELELQPLIIAKRPGELQKH